MDNNNSSGGGNAPTTSSNKMYPHIIEKKVWVKRKLTIPVLPVKGVSYNVAEDYSFRIGSAFYHGTTMPLGKFVLTPEEEAICMPELIGISKNHQEYDKTLTAYWHSFSVPVDFNGLELNVSTQHTDEKNWRPLNIFHYVIWKYCLNYADVANVKEDINKSPKIRFFLWDESEQLIEDKTKLKMKDQAFIARMKATEDVNKGKAILDLFNISVPENDEIRFTLALSQLAEQQPEKFLAYYQDKNLLMKSFVERCVTKGLLTRPIGSTVIGYDGRLIANSVDEAVIFLMDEKNSVIKMTLEAKLNSK